MRRAHVERKDAGRDRADRCAKSDATLITDVRVVAYGEVAQPRHAQTESDAPHVLGPQPVAGRVERGQRQRPVPPLALDEVLFLVGVVQRRRVADERPERPEEGGPVPGRVVLAARVAVSY